MSDAPLPPRAPAPAMRIVGIIDDALAAAMADDRMSAPGAAAGDAAAPDYDGPDDGELEAAAPWGMRDSAGVRAAASGPGFDAVDVELAGLPANDTGNAQRLIRRFGDEFRFVREVGPYVWCGTHWDGVGGREHAMRLAQRTAEAVNGEARALMAAGPRDGEGGEDFQKRVRRHFGWAVTSGNAGRIAAMIDQAGPHCTHPPEDFDADPMRLNVGNGTLVFSKEIEDGGGVKGVVRLEPHRRDALHSKVCDVMFDPDATAPVFERFLARVVPDVATHLFLQTWFGYCLTGLVTEQKLVFFYGAGANGKSTLVDLFARMLSGYSTSLRFESLAGDGQRRGDAATPDLARLPGVRMVRAAEPEQGARFKEAEVKAITGGEPMLVRHLQKGFFELRPCFKLVLSGNHKPDIRGLDEGIWRRFLLVPFNQVIPAEERDPRLPDKLWAERAGILNWALDGLRIYLERGLQAPDEVRAATAGYREESDPIGAFLRDCTEPDAEGGVQAGVLYRAYEKWAVDNGLRPWSGTAFGRAMMQKGATRTNERVRRYLDIRLLLEAMPDAPRPHYGRGDDE